MPSQADSLDAATLFQDRIDKAASQNLPVADLFLAATTLRGLGQTQLVAQLYKAWIAFNASDPLLYAVYFNFGVALAEVPDPTGAINALRESIRLKPDFQPPYINLGRVLEDNQQLPLAVAQWTELVNRLSTVNGESVANKNTALQQIGRVLEGAFEDSAAEAALKQSLDLNAAQAEVVQHWIALRQRQCKWPVLEPSDRISRLDLVTGISPLSLANLSDDPMFQLAKANRYNKHSVGMPRTPRPRLSQSAGIGRPRRKLKLGYVSSDLREHAVGFAMTDLMESHSREDLEVHAFYCGIPRTDPTQQRIKSAVDHWVDITDLDDQKAAGRIAESGIDIMVDLNGYTKSARTGVFALRPAPIAVNWFGFPGTMGSPYHHYIVADPYIIPEGQEIYYSEKVLRLPCYQPNDRRRVVASRRPTREEERLPAEATVFCCLNGMQKLTSITFERWMSILGQVPGSVLWLLSGAKDTNERLRQAASQQGVAAERLVFADKKPNPEHLARYPLADLFLDNLPYGAHTTAADSMWMGVPILTLSGKSFASRVCGSLVSAAGLGDMVCATPEAYVARAVELGRNRAALAAVRQRLISGRDTCLLFDMSTLVRELEALYREMWRDFEGGRLPRPDLSNLDVYHEIGAELEIETMDLLTEEAYRALYAERLARLDEVYPIKPDARLWRTAAT